MTTPEIARKLVDMNRAGDYATIYQELYAENVVSIENWGDKPEVYEGMEAIGKKGEEWMVDVEEMHETSCSDH